MIVQDNVPEAKPTITSIRNILNKVNKKIRVKFMLYCAKDVMCFVPEADRKIALKGIEVLTNWVNDVNKKQLKHFDPSGLKKLGFLERLTCAVWYTIRSASQPRYESSHTATTAMLYASCLHNINGSVKETVKIQEYTNYLNLIKSIYIVVPKSIDCFLQDDNLVTGTAVALDFLEDEGDTWVEKAPEGYKLNIKSLDIVGKTKIDLARKIVNHPFLLNWFKEIYKEKK